MRLEQGSAELLPVLCYHANGEPLPPFVFGCRFVPTSALAARRFVSLS